MHYAEEAGQDGRNTCGSSRRDKGDKNDNDDDDDDDVKVDSSSLSNQSKRRSRGLSRPKRQRARLDRVGTHHRCVADVTALMSVIGNFACDIRMYAIKTYSTVIHEFDPWFQLDVPVPCRSWSVRIFPLV